MAAKTKETEEPKVKTRFTLPEIAPLADSKTRLYWIGLRQDCLLDVANAAGMSFCKTTTPVVTKKSRGGVEEQVRQNNVGRRVELTLEQIERILHGVSMRVVRQIGSGKEAYGEIRCTHRLELVDVKEPNGEKHWVVNPRYKRKPNDTMLADWVYIAAVDELGNSELLDPNFEPKPLSQADG